MENTLADSLTTYTVDINNKIRGLSWDTWLKGATVNPQIEFILMNSRNDNKRNRLLALAARLKQNDKNKRYH